MRKSDVLKSLPVKPQDFVVEVGSGPDPYPHTDLILEKYPFDNTERWGSVKQIAPIVQADAIEMPLKDQTCDALFVSHVLEHIDQPARFLEEAKRVAKKVYLEFPTFYRELMYAWSFHKWVIEIQDDTLICYSNDIPQMFGDYFHRNYDLLLHYWSEERFEELNSFIFCNPADLKVEISSHTAIEVAMQRGAKGAENQIRYPSLRILTLLAYNMMPGSIIRWKQRRSRSAAGRLQELNASLLQKFICLKCRKSELEKTVERILCKSCGAEYPCVQGIYHFAPQPV
jgi:SAM-dependent methyltransferase